VHVAVFGAKDAQQAAIVRRMATDLCFPVEVVVAPTVREADGLAMSSRNAYLAGEARRAAAVLHRALETGRTVVLAGERRGAALEVAMAAEIRGEPLTALEYAAAVDPDTLHPAVTVRGRVLLALAARVGSTRLIDNLLLEGLM
jgi:pantoate--beta-alanine ligase